jgi:hypothetical protein
LWLLPSVPAAVLLAATSRSGRMEPAVDGREESVVALGPGVDAEVGRRRGVRVLVLGRGSWLEGLARSWLEGLARSWLEGLDAGGDSALEMPREGELACPTRPY